MRIGVPKEIKKHEYRVGLTPSAVSKYVAEGHELYVEREAGIGTGFTDTDYIKAGAIMCNVDDTFDKAEMIIKVKEPQGTELSHFCKDHILFTYLHLAADKKLTQELMSIGLTSIAYETIQLPNRSHPCLTPMSEIAGRLSVQEGAKYLETPFGGAGILLGGIPGVKRGKVVILGGGVVGFNAAKIASGIGASTTILDISQERLAYLDDVFGSSVQTLFSNDANIESEIANADVVIGSVYVHGASAPKLVRRNHLKSMKKGAVLVDVAIDQGGCFETSKATTHDKPIYDVDGIVHYCVANMPGVVPQTSTVALNNQTLRYGLEIASGTSLNKYTDALKLGVNTHDGKLVCEAVANTHNLQYSVL
ncbi:MAG: alanine dehydrogenase [Flavobacteriaceae bacterium TMED42]|nr:MAG: alanine dehydrogenase [Flavobacteriaceae bacterium TMED42]